MPLNQLLGVAGIFWPRNSRLYWFGLCHQTLAIPDFFLLWQMQMRMKMEMKMGKGKWVGGNTVPFG